MHKTPAFVAVSLLTLGMMTYLLFNHLQYAVKFTNLAVCYSIMFVHLALKMLASLAAKPHTVAPGADLDLLRVDVVVPIYNEDPALLAAGITAMAGQDRRPRALWLVDDGSQADGVPVLALQDPAVLRAIAEAERAGITVVCRRQDNSGKREAQSVAFAESDADIFVTTDSDTYLRADALANLLIPFSRPEVMSVGGTAYGQNYRKNLLTRSLDLGFVMSFLQGRVAEGYFGSVRVNCGILAAYRGHVVRENLHRFLNQRFMGVPVRAGDDRALTFFAKEKGRTEFQPYAVAFSALPENLSHLARQRMRWARSWCWGTLWLLRRPIRSADFLFTATQTLGILAYGFASSIALVGAISGAISVDLLIWSVLVAMGIGYLSHLRYVLIAQQQEPLHQRLITWAVSPLTSALYLGLLLPLYYRALAQPAPRAWGTRQRVEVGLHPTATTAPDTTARTAAAPTVTASDTTAPTADRVVPPELPTQPAGPSTAPAGPHTPRAPAGRPVRDDRGVRVG
ncbi:glycosyltransferase [Nakamurella flavida]|uniref:Hyaluronan synthase n=1 Tax=Nakamurella flavida TaxID=363630 RepID=A0A938YLC1_9ACTN|nr:glycosyltransferase family 2 protein [Nakamurella flavida]MBM9475527.1 glycosyltransferase [Nakamurella flavida]MDP9778198.1 cellulose synthase/poly-beta-1,6-N-acetylglucosamine synthase-like glycosyltransferase [Nakamurella flavida]